MISLSMVFPDRLLPDERIQPSVFVELYFQLFAYLK